MCALHALPVSVMRFLVPMPIHFINESSFAQSRTLVIYLSAKFVVTYDSKLKLCQDHDEHLISVYAVLAALVIF